MATDLNKLTKLEALKQLATRVNKDFATKTSVTGLQDRVDVLQAVGSEKNKIEKIKVNGEEQQITEDERSVNIAVPQNVSELKDHEKYATIESIDAKISSVYKPGGSKPFDELPDATEENLGYVYNITDNFTTNENFVEGADSSYPKGTNVVVVDIGSGSYKYDVLAGFVDLTEYAKTADVVKKDNGKVLSSNDYTNEDKEKLNGIEIATTEEVDAVLNEVFGGE